MGSSKGARTNLINLELRARETCTVLEKTEGGKNSAHFDSELPYTGSSLHSGSHRSRFQSGNPSKSGGNIKCIFCRGNHWSDKCNVISDFEARKDFLKKEKICFLCLKPDHLSCNCTKTIPCNYCKGMHNSAICNDRNKQGNQTFMNCASNVSSIFLQTADIVLANPNNKKQVKTKVLFDQGSDRSYVTKRIKNVLDLAAIAEETISTSTFMNKTCENFKLERVSIN